MTSRVEQGKGQRDRYVMLSPQLLELLRDSGWASRPRAWLFPGQNPVNPMSAQPAPTHRLCGGAGDENHPSACRRTLCVIA